MPSLCTMRDISWSYARLSSHTLYHERIYTIMHWHQNLWHLKFRCVLYFFLQEIFFSTILWNQAIMATIPSTMKAAVIHEHGGTFTIKDVPVPVPKRTEARIFFILVDSTMNTFHLAFILRLFAMLVCLLPLHLYFWSFQVLVKIYSSGLCHTDGNLKLCTCSCHFSLHRI